MATYYVSTTTGNNSNAGTSAALPWLTLAFALGAASGTNTGLVGGDIVYIAPGNYNEAVTLGFTSPSSTVQILGDPLNLQGFPSVTPGNIYWYNSGACLSATSKNNITIKNIYFERANGSFPVALALTTCYSWTLQQCIFASVIQASVAQSVSLGLTVDRCIFPWTYIGYSGITISGATGANYDIATVIKDCLCVGQAGLLIINGGTVGGVTVTNCTVLSYDQAIRNTSTNTTHKLTVKNCLIVATTCIFAGTSLTTVGDFNHRIQGGATNVAETNTITTIQLGYDGGYARLTGVGLNDFFGSYLTSPNLGTGTATGAPTSDLYGVTWLANPDIGAVQRSASLNFQQQANPTERNASAITIAPGSTSQSIELYLGVTGLTASTSGLSARYNRTRTASVDIPLVARTIAQAWTAGGFAEVDATNMPGVYRLDVPDAALAAGADDVTIVVRGASGTNGAVMTVKLSSGGLTSAQTAAAVWDPLYTSYTSANSMGARVLKTAVDNRLVNVGTGQHIEANIHAVVDSTAAASELSGALLHNGTDYISAELLTPVSAATSVHIGPYQLLADGLGADQPLDVNVGTATSIDVQVTDANGTGIDITGATVSAKVYNSGGTLVATYAGTATYADNGRLSFGLTTTVTNTSGTYTVTVTRTTGATDTQIFGPLRLYVRPV
jgi:hypothetical protein